MEDVYDGISVIKLPFVLGQPEAKFDENEYHILVIAKNGEFVSEEV